LSVTVVANVNYSCVGVSDENIVFFVRIFTERTAVISANMQWASYSCSFAYCTPLLS